MSKCDKLKKKVKSLKKSFEKSKAKKKAMKKLINAEFDKLASITNDQLRAKTDEIKATIDAKLKHIDDEVASLKSKIDSDTSLDIHQKDEIFTTIDDLEEKRNVQLEEVLLEVYLTFILPNTVVHYY